MLKRQVIKLNKVEKTKWRKKGYTNHFRMICDLMVAGYKQSGIYLDANEHYIYKRVKRQMRKNHRDCPKPISKTDFKRLLYPDDYPEVSLNMLDILECILKEIYLIKEANYTHKLNEPSVLFIDYAAKSTIELHKYIYEKLRTNSDIEMPFYLRRSYMEATSTLQNILLSQRDILKIPYDSIFDFEPEESS